MLTRRENIKLLVAASVLGKLTSKAAPGIPNCPTCSGGGESVNLQLDNVLDAAPRLALGSMPPTLLETTASARDGAAFHYVSSATGKLAFRVYDIAVDDTPTISLVRYYNGSNQTDSGLGVGWSLELDDTIEVSGDSATLRSGSGETLQMRLDSSGSTYTPSDPALTMHRSVSVAADGTLREELDPSGDARIYSKVNGIFHLSSLNYGDYGVVSIQVGDNGKIASISTHSSRIALTWSSGASPRLVSVSDNTGRSVKYSYENGSLSSVTDVAGGVWTLSSDSNGLTSVVDPEGRTALAAVYSGARVASVDSIAGHTDYSYSGDGTTTIGSGRDVTIVKHNSNGQIVNYGLKADPNLVTLRYDDRSRLVERTVAETQAGTWSYDGQDRLVRYSSGETTLRWSYDRAGRIAAHSINGIEQNFTHNDRGQAVASASRDSSRAYQATYARGQLAGYRSGSHSASMEYDALGQLTAFVNDSDRYEYGRDAHGWLMSTRDANGYEIQYTRNARGQVTSRKDTEGRQLNYTRDKAGYLARVDSADGLWVEAARDDRGRITRLTNSFGQSREFSYDSTNRLATYKDALGRQFTFGYSPGGEAHSMVQQGGSLVMSRVRNKAADSSRRAVPKWYQDGWQDPSEAHSPLGSFNDGAVAAISNPDVSAGVQPMGTSLGPAGASSMCQSQCNAAACTACKKNYGTQVSNTYKTCIQNANRSYRNGHIACLAAGGAAFKFTNGNLAAKRRAAAAAITGCEITNNATWISTKGNCTNTKNNAMQQSQIDAACATPCTGC